MESNIGSALLILGTIYLNLIYHLNWLPTGFFIAFGIATWTYPAFSGERKEILKAQKDLMEAKAYYYNCKVN